MNNSYADLLSKYIEESKLSLGEISVKLAQHNIRVDRSYISKLKNGNKPPASEELTRALAEITGGDVNKLLVAGQMERLEPVFEMLGEEGFEEFLNSIIGYAVSRQHFVDEMNRRHEAKCREEGKAFTPLTAEELQEGFRKASMEDKIKLSQFFSYTLDKQKNAITVFPMMESSADVLKDTHSDSNAQDNSYKRAFEELGFDKVPPKEDEVNVLRIALKMYRMGKENED
ncbi:hypothetical protein D3P09_02795 [Paenibacillus pinisoli]|uniref:Uncharacterized protein n=1 Tax=Paenibacillus pinisoli TaxID=1276110 RepID=A0A3A6Q087_9BACL|nr:helix-turn-helix transcriptional regulator [Paenibacillus pinisoli]RJX40963.1 hypothetical protein D3P09_02795 [Paenibacillus pinisoli]